MSEIQVGDRVRWVGGEGTVYRVWNEQFPAYAEEQQVVSVDCGAVKGLVTMRAAHFELIEKNLTRDTPNESTA